MSNIPDISPEEKSKLTAEAAKIVNSRNIKHTLAVMIVALVENAKLTQEVNRLRALAGEEAIKEF